MRRFGIRTGRVLGACALVGWWATAALAQPHPGEPYQVVKGLGEVVMVLETPDGRAVIVKTPDRELFRVEEKFAGDGKTVIRVNERAIGWMEQ